MSRRSSADQPMPGTPARIRRASTSPDGSPSRSIWVMSPVTTIREPSPMRVRNIFICAEVVFCPSSRMMKAFASVRPRM